MRWNLSLSIDKRPDLGAVLPGIAGNYRMLPMEASW